MAHEHGAQQPQQPQPPGHGGPDGGSEQAQVDHTAMGHGAVDQAAMGRAAMDDALMTSAVTGPQLAAVSILTVLALVGAFVFGIARYNLTLSNHDVGGLVMAPGMIMDRETTAESMRDMAAASPWDVTYVASPDERGDRPLEARIENGVKVYDLDTSVIRWNILQDAQVTAYAFNRQVPGPRIRITEGDRVRFNVRNGLPESTSVHWHGLILPNAMDGAAEVTQPPIEPGERFTYEFTAVQAGTFFYHTHDHPDRQQPLGLYGALIIDPKTPPAFRWDKELVVQLQEWTHRDGYTYPAMPMEGAMPNFFTINGKAYPETETVDLKVGDRLLVRFIGSNSTDIHPMHIHGGPFELFNTDGQPIPEGGRWTKDTVNVAPGERYDVVWTALEPGKWLLHCHINHHATNDNREREGGGGLMLILNVTR
jgi:FtsP/CotA-like multicopper oxidase with cupredoxin domain